MTDPRLPKLLNEVGASRLDRRSLLRRGAALGLALPASATVRSAAGASAPASFGRMLPASQIDASTLVIADNLATGGLWLTFDPGRFYEINPLAAINMVYEGLYYLPDPARPDYFVPMLAAADPQVSEDGLQVTVPLRSGVRFQHTGNEMTAEDWLFSLNRMKNLKGNPAFLVTDYWDSVEALDPLTLRFNLSTPNPALVPILSTPFITVLDSRAVREHGATDAPDADQTDTAQEYLNGNSHGTGPFVMRQWDVNTEVIIERNPNYWGEAQQLERIIWRNIAAATEQLQSVQVGEADIAYSVDPDAAAEVEADESLQLLTSATLAIEYLAMHNGEEVGGPLANRDVRRAVAFAVDYDGIINGLLAGSGLRPATIVPLPLPGSEAVQDAAYRTDLVRAQESFDAAGLGEVELTLSYGSGEVGFGGVDVETLATKLQSDLQRIRGLTIRLNPMDPNTRIAEFRDGKLQFCISPWGPDYPDVQGYVEPFGRSKTVVAKRVSYANPEVDRLLDQAMSERDPARRTDLYAQVQRLLVDDAPYVVLYQPIDQKPARTTVVNARAHPFYQLDLRGASKTK
ncbi:MAG: ABC transporter substrate-binding protein [Chloroflexota bacterium]|nr:ABC transporter substrate-binding protein [Chloroflexota bacterium]